MTRSKPKKDISQTNLNYHNIFYDADLFRPPCILPGHVDAVRETLLSFENIVPGGTGWTETFQDELARYEPRHISPESALPPDASFIPVAGYEKDLNERSPQWHTAHDNMKSCEEVAKTAWKLENDMEDGWTNFWRQSTFTVVSETTKNQPGFHPVLDKWSLEGNCSWTEFDNFEPCGPDLSPRTLPKPDLAYAFPVVNRMFENLKGAERDAFSRCFSLEAIQMLAAKGTISTVTRGLRKSAQSTQKCVLSTADRACFPWAVVEVKKQVPAKHCTPVERCYCQAANAAAAAIALRAQLFDKVVRDAYSTMPPVIAFTCCGPEVKVWLMYYMEPDAEGKRARRMVCVWSTSVLLTWGVASLRSIIMNMHTWASRILKPRIQACIFEILQRPGHPFISRAVSPFQEVAIAELFQTPRSEDSDSLSSCRSDDSLTLLNIDETPCRGKKDKTATNTRPTVITPRLVSSPFGNPMTCEKATLDANFVSSQNMYQDDTLLNVPNIRSPFTIFDRLATQKQQGGKAARTTELNNQDKVAQVTVSLMTSHLEDVFRQKLQLNESVDAQVDTFEQSAVIEKSHNPTGLSGQVDIFGTPASHLDLSGSSTSTSKAKGGLFGNPATAPKATGGLFGNITSTPKATGGLFGNTTSVSKAKGGLFDNPAIAPKATGGLFGNTTAIPKTTSGLFGGNPAIASKTTGGLLSNPITSPKTRGNPTSTPKATGGLFSNSATIPKVTGGLFGNITSTPKAKDRLFGNPATAPKATGGLFSNPANIPKVTGGLFGGNPTSTSKTTGGLFGNPINNPQTAGESRRSNPNATFSPPTALFRHPIDAEPIKTKVFDSPPETISLADGLFGRHNASEAIRNASMTIIRSFGDEIFGSHDSSYSVSKKSGDSIGEETGSEYPVSECSTKSTSRYLLQEEHPHNIHGSPRATRRGTSTSSYVSTDTTEDDDYNDDEDDDSDEDEDGSQSEDADTEETSDLEESSGAEELGDTVLRRRIMSMYRPDYISPTVRKFVVPCRKGEHWGNQLYVPR